MVRGYDFPDSSEPLDADERAAVIDATEDSQPPAEVTVIGILYAGLRALAAPHITSDMVSVSGDKLKITLPPGSHECDIIGPVAPSPKNNGLGGSRSCNLCDDGTFEFEAPRTIPVFEERAVKVLSEWFDLYRHMPSHGAMIDHLHNVGEKAGVDRLKPSVLRHTYGVMLAGKGFTRDEIASAMGLKTDQVTSSRIVSYGRLCEGFNPFKCGAETDAGKRCEIIVKEGQCYYHSSGQL